jgi:FkbM family methyltransferase
MSVRRTLGAFGFELRRRAAGHCWGADPYADQWELLAGADVRTVFDVGANIGQTTAVNRGLFPGATVHAFEPFPDTFAELTRNTAASPAVRPHRLALADQAGRVAFHANRSHYTNSLLPPAGAAERYVGPGLMEPVCQLEVDAVRLDDFCRDQRIDRIDVLKIDVQGGEALVLKGGAGMLAARAVRLVCLEVLFAPMYAGQAFFRDVDLLLGQAGYCLFGLYNAVYSGRDGMAWADAIYLPK